MSQFVTLFAKETKFGLRYWASISTKTQEEGKKKPTYVSANISCNLSDDAKKIFKKNAVETSNDEVTMLRAELTDFWLKAIEGKDGEFVILFINRIKPAEKEDD